MDSIRHIIFDFGNVLINLDFDDSKIAFAMLLGIEGAVHTKQKLDESGIFPQYERGEVSEKTFFQAFRDASGQQGLKDADLSQAWLALLKDIPKDRLELLRKLRQSYSLYILSNINHGHATAIHQYLEREHGLSEAEWRGMFKGVYYSHEVGHRKPEPAIYQHLLHDAGLVPSECLFIDDLAENTEVARSLGIHTHTHNPKEDISEILPRLLGQKHSPKC